MDNAIHFSFYLDPLWDIVKRVRDKVENVLAAYSDELRDASKMTASELMENAVKYGTAVQQGKGISFEFTATEEKITIVVTNRLLNQEDGEEAKRHIDVIHATENPEALYIQRLQALMEDLSLQKTELGLYRIAYEGQFMLSYACCDHDVISIKAVRTVNQPDEGAKNEKL